MHTQNHLRYGFGHTGNGILPPTRTSETRVHAFFDGIVSATTSSARTSTERHTTSSSSRDNSANCSCQVSCDQE